MQYYFGHVTTQFYGMEWGHFFLVSAPDTESAIRKANQEDWTHGDGIEEQEEASLQQIPEEHYQVLKEYLLVI